MKRIAALALGTLLAAPAFAGGPVVVAEEPAVVPAPIVAPTADWGGLYVGGQLGYGDFDTNLDDVDGDGAIGGVHVGYRYDFGRAVIGAELAYDKANIDFDNAFDTELDEVTTLKFTAGGEIGTRGLLYLALGNAWANATLGGEDYSDDDFFYGVGYAHKLTDQWTVGAELLRHDFSDFEDTGVDIDGNVLQARVSFQF